MAHLTIWLEEIRDEVHEVTATPQRR